jgi:hypothetical protein
VAHRHSVPGPNIKVLDTKTFVDITCRLEHGLPAV